MISIFLAFFTALPSLVNGVNAFTKSYYDAKVQIVRAKTGLEEAKARDIVNASMAETHEGVARLSVIAGNKVLVWLVVAFATPLVIFIWKVVVIDIVIGPGCIWLTSMCWVGSTDPIKGEVAGWASTIIWSIFGSSTALGLGKMILAHKSED